MTELLKKRITLSFTFDAVIDDANITTSGNTEDIQAMDIALLHKLIETSPKQLNMLIGYDALFALMFDDIEAMSSEIIGYAGKGEDFLHSCYIQAIDALKQPFKSEWQEIYNYRHIPGRGVPLATFSECVESITGCISTQLVEKRMRVEES